jgi:glycosyltransferase involved in cell wall biosynthesis
MSAGEKSEPNRLLVVNQASRMQALELVAELGRSGWDCTIVTGSVPRDLTPPKNARLVIGASLRRTGMFARIGSSGCFTAQALWHVARNRRVPVLVVTNPPVLPLFLPLLRALLGVQYSVLVYDVYPDVAEQMGILKPGGLIGRSWRRASRLTMRSAETVITIGDCMARTLRGHLRPEDPLNITVIPTWVDAELIRPMNKAENPLVRRHGLEGRFVVMYCGNFGATHDLTSLIDAAELLRDCPDVFFVLIGGGTRVREVTASVAQRKLRNLALLPLQSSEHLPLWLAAADCAVVSLDEAFVGVSMPSKTYFAMAAGSALVAVSPPGTDLAAVVQAAGCGIHVPPRNAKALAGAIRRLCNDASYLEQCKVNSRRAAVREFDRARLVQRFADHLQEAFSGRRVPVGHATRGQLS